MIKQYKLSEYTLTRTAEADLWENLAISFFAKVLENTGDDQPDIIDIEFEKSFVDRIDKQEEPLDIKNNIKEFEKALNIYRKI